MRRLEIIAARNQDQRRTVVDVAEQIFGIVAGAADAEPEDVDGNALLQHFEVRRLARDRVSSVASDHQVGANLRLTLRRLRHYAANPSAFVDQIDRLVLQAQVEAGELLRLAGKKIQEVPLRHQRDKLAVSRQRAEIGGAKGEVAENSTG